MNKIIEIIEIGTIKSLVQRECEPTSELIKTEDLVEELNDLLYKIGFTLVSEQEPPKNVELLAESPEGIKHITSWRPAYNIFSCQNKDESSYNWKYKVL